MASSKIFRNFRFPASLRRTRLFLPLVFIIFFTVMYFTLQLLSSPTEPVIFSQLPPVLFPPNNPLIIWSNEWHIAPIYDLKTVLKPFGVNVLDKNLAFNCYVTKSCAKLKVINFENVMNLTEMNMVEKFYDAYKEDDEMRSVDAFVCMHPASVCELFEPFNKTMIIISTLRYEVR